MKRTKVIAIRERIKALLAGRTPDDLNDAERIQMFDLMQEMEAAGAFKFKPMPEYQNEVDDEDE